MKSVFHKSIERYGWESLVRLPFYPLTLAVFGPFRFLQALFSCRLLMRGNWNDYSHFHPRPGMNALFYWTEAVNLARYGRTGVSPCIGLGCFPLSRWFHLTKPSLLAFWKGGAVTVLGGMLLWWGSHIVWLSEVHFGKLALLMGVVLLSPFFYLNAFFLQNYNVVGWIFFPLGLFGWLQGEWEVAALAWLLASFGSFTVVVLAGMLSIVLSITMMNIVPLITFLPAAIKVSTHFWPVFQKGERKGFADIARVIGLKSKDAKYVRRYMKGFSHYHVYYFLLYLQFFLFAWILEGRGNVLFGAALSLFVFNSKFARFTDEQSMQMLLASVGVAVVLQGHSPWLLASLWFMLAPLPRLAGFPDHLKRLDVVPKIEPFNVRCLIREVESFLTPVKSGQKVFMAFDDPKGEYEKIFDGYRVLLELPLYVASKSEIHFMPDWWFISELSLKSSPEYWGRDLNSVRKNINLLGADFVVIYEEEKSQLDPIWEKAGFSILNKIDWSCLDIEVKGCIPHKDGLKWWLLKCP